MPSKRRRRRRSRRRQNPAKTLALLVLVVLVLVGAFVGMHKLEQSRYHQERGETSEYFY